MPNPKISLYFLGTDSFAVTVLQRLVDDDQFEILGVITPPDRKAGRKQEVQSCAVKKEAVENGLKVEHDLEVLKGKEMDFLVVVSYGYFLDDEVLQLPKYASLNVHASLLPKYRGASPVASAVLNGDEVTGVSVMQMVKKMDAGPVYAVSEVAILEHDTEPVLRERLADVGAELLAQVVPGIATGNAEAQEQDEKGISYAPLIKKQDGLIDWENETAIEIERKLRAYTPWPGIYTNFEGKRLKILKGRVKSGDVIKPGKVRKDDDDVVVEAKDGLFVLEEIQLDGKRALPVDEFIRGQASFVGVVF